MLVKFCLRGNFSIFIEFMTFYPVLQTGCSKSSSLSFEIIGILLS